MNFFVHLYVTDKTNKMMRFTGIFDKIGQVDHIASNCSINKGFKIMWLGLIKIKLFITKIEIFIFREKG